MCFVVEHSKDSSLCKYGPCFWISYYAPKTMAVSLHDPNMKSTAQTWNFVDATFLAHEETALTSSQEAVIWTERLHTTNYNLLFEKTIFVISRSRGFHQFWYNRIVLSRKRLELLIDPTRRHLLQFLVTPHVLTHVSTKCLRIWALLTGSLKFPSSTDSSRLFFHISRWSVSGSVIFEIIFWRYHALTDYLTTQLYHCTKISTFFLQFLNYFGVVWIILFKDTLPILALYSPTPCWHSSTLLLVVNKLVQHWHMLNKKPSLALPVHVDQ